MDDFSVYKATFNVCFENLIRHRMSEEVNLVLN